MGSTRGKRSPFPAPLIRASGANPRHRLLRSAIAGAMVSQTTPRIGSTGRATSAAEMPIHAPLHAPIGPPLLCTAHGPSTPICC